MSEILLGALNSKIESKTRFILHCRKRLSAKDVEKVRASLAAVVATLVGDVMPSAVLEVERE